MLGPLRYSAYGPISLDLSSCGGLSDASLEALQTPGVQQDSSRDNWLEELRIGGSSALSAPKLLWLARATTGDGRPLLHHLRHLDVSHVQSLSRGAGSRASAGPGAAASGGDSPAAQALAALLEAAGSSLRTAVLDGCFLGGGLLLRLPTCCPGLERLSLVGCSGLGDADLAALAGLQGLRDFAVGGSSLAWHEHRALTGAVGRSGINGAGHAVNNAFWGAPMLGTHRPEMLHLCAPHRQPAGLSSLTRLRLARRPFLTDAQLAPLLAANRSSLQRLELAGCASLTDAALLHLLPPAAQHGGGGEAGAQSSHQAEGQGKGQADGQGSGDAGQQQPAEEPEQPADNAPPFLPPPPPLERLQLVCCDRMTGSSLRHLVRLRSLHLSGCPGISGVALQVRQGRDAPHRLRPTAAWVAACLWGC